MTGAQKSGYYDGYKHGLAGEYFNPAPDPIAATTYEDYKKVYWEHYDKGFREGRAAKELILRDRNMARSERHLQSRER